MMGHVDDHLVFELRITALQDSQDVRGVLTPNVGGQTHRQCGFERNRPEFSRLGQLSHLVQIAPT